MMLDSSNMGMQERIRIVKDIQREYEDVDGWVCIIFSVFLVFTFPYRKTS
jgi:hypothetical protein